MSDASSKSTPSPSAHDGNTVPEVEIRKLPSAGHDRVESGPVQFGDDWPSLFLRGDDCAGLWLALETVLSGAPDPLARMYMKSFQRRLSATRLRPSGGAQ